MSAAIPTRIPDQVNAGDTWTWQIALADYSAADGWALSYAFLRHDTGLRILVTSTASGADHLVNVSAATTTAFEPGDYEGQGYVTKASERFKVWEGRLKVLPNYATGEQTDTRTIARKTLDAIEAGILKVHQANAAGRAGAITEWTAEGLSVKREDQAGLLAELISQRDRYRAIVSHEEAHQRRQAGRATGRRILTTFVSPR
jgi:hypothetical protein